MSSPTSINFRRTLPWLMAEGALAMGYETLVGPVYLAAWAGQIGLPESELPWITSLPLLGAVGQLLGVLALSRLTRKVSLKWLCIALSLVARSLWALVFLLPLLSRFSTFAADGARQIGLLATLSSAIGLTSASLWMAWMKGWAPRRFEGRFWGFRARGSTLGVIAAHLLAAVSLHGTRASGFALLLAIALLSALGSLAILTRIPSVARTPAETEAPDQSLSLKDLHWLIVLCVFQAGVSFVSPFFPYYFTRQLGLAPSEISIWYAITQLGISVSAIFWGSRWDRAFSQSAMAPARLLRLTGCVLALSPLLYVVNDIAILHWAAPIEFFCNGLAWAGLQIGVSSILFKQAGRAQVMRAGLLFSLMTAAQGLSGAGASWLGGWTAHALQDWGGFRALWALGTVLRLTIAYWVLPLLHSPNSLAISPKVSQAPG